MHKINRLLGVLLASAVLTACGGGGSDAGQSLYGQKTDTGSGTPPDVVIDAVAQGLIMTSSAAEIANTTEASVSFTVRAVNASGNVIANVPVQFSVDAGGVIEADSSKTNTSGIVSAKLSIGSNQSNRIITVTATSGSVSKSIPIQVAGTTIASTLVPAILDLNKPGEVQYRVVDKSGNAMPGQAITINATGLVPPTATGVTGPSGDFVFKYTSPSVSGIYNIEAQVAGQTNVQSVQVQPSVSLPEVDTAEILSASVSANPAVVGVNLENSTSNRSEIRALFLGKDNKPIRNVRVQFDLAGDKNSIGGTLASGNQILYSDSNGVVTTSYAPGGRSSPTDGVTVRACFGGKDTDPNLLNKVTCRNVTLSVTADPLGVSIGTNELIIVDELTYTKKFLVSVTDSAGVAKSDVAISASIDLPRYRKGFYFFPIGGVGSKWIQQLNAVCSNEDANRNGVLDTGEDFNIDGQLWPRKPDVVLKILQGKTRADGTAELQLTYAKDHASWVDALITVSASGVSGSEGRAVYSVSPVPVEASALTDANVVPAFVLSPYGKSTSCTDPN
jgi:Bacterial Ig-like domain (group 1)